MNDYESKFDNQIKKPTFKVLHRTFVQFEVFDRVTNITPKRKIPHIWLTFWQTSDGHMGFSVVFLYNLIRHST